MQKTQTICLVILATIAVGFSLYYLKSVLLPFVIACFIVIGCRPILEFIEKRLNLPRAIAFFVSFLIGALLLLCFALVIWMSVNDLSNHSEIYEKRLNNIITWVVDHIPNDGEDSVGNSDQANHASSGTGESLDLTDNSDSTVAIRNLLNSMSSYVQTQWLGLAGSLSSLLSYGVLISIFVFFLLLGNSDPAHQLREAGTDPPKLLREIEEQVRKYLVMKTVISLITGIAFGFVLWLFGVPLAVVFGFLAFLLNFIPNIGPLISSLLPVPFLVLNSNISPSTALICFILISSIQFISGNVIETRIMGKSFDVSPVTLLLALMFFGLVWGIVGMFLATPIVSIIKIVFQQQESSRPIAGLLSGRLDIFRG